MPGTKICKHCESEKPLTKEYFIFRNDRQKWEAKCKECKKLYALKNKEEIKKYKQEYYKKNKEEISEKNKEYHQRNKKAISEYKKQWVKDNKDRLSKKRKILYQKNKEVIKKNRKNYPSCSREYRRKYENEYRKNRRKQDLSLRVRQSVSSQIRFHIKKNGGSKSASILKKLPYTIQELRDYLESKFDKWMTWENYGPYRADKRTWQIDHITPQSKLPYDSMDHLNFKICWALKNLRPLEALENIIKGNNDG